MTFRIGQEVVCVDGWEAPGPQTGKVYVVSWIGTRVTTPVGFDYEDGRVHLRLEGFKDGFRADGTPFIWTFNPARFRPVVKTDISIFTAMLVSPHERVPA
jgi:hypothetical protein